MTEGSMTTPQAELSAEVLKVLEQQQQAANATASPMRSAPSGSSSTNTQSLGEKE